MDLLIARQRIGGNGAISRNWSAGMLDAPLRASETGLILSESSEDFLERVMPALAYAEDATMLTAAEVATVADVTTRYVHQVVEEKVLPQDVYVTGKTRRFRPCAAAFVAFNQRASAILTKEARRNAYLAFVSRHRSELIEEPGWGGLRKLSSTETIDSDSVQSDVAVVAIRVAIVFEEVADRLDQLQKAEAIIVQDPLILSGVPVVRGTRIPVHDIAASIDAKIPLARIRAAYPSIGSEEIEIVYLWAKANPIIGRPRKTEIPRSAIVSSERVPRRRRASDAASH